MTPKIVGTYEFVDGDNFVAYLKNIGLSDEQIEHGRNSGVKPTVEISQKGDTYTMNVKHAGTTYDFKLGEEFTELAPGGKKVKALIKQEGDKFVQSQTFENGFHCNVDMEDTGSCLKMTYTWPQGKAVRNFKRI